MNKTVLYITAICFLFCTQNAFSKSAFSISFGPVNLGNSRIPLNLGDFNISVSDHNEDFKAIFVRDSVQWVRTENNLLIPRARLGLIFSDITKTFHIQHHGETIIPQLRKNQYYTEIFINLFNPTAVHIKSGQTNYSSVVVTAKPVEKGKKSHLIDYSCSRNQIKITGLDDQYISLGCRMERRGAYGKERPRLSVTWTTSNYTLKDKTPPPYTSFFNSSHPVKLKLIDKEGLEREVTISAKVPKRLHRLKLAYGLGPYTFSSTFEGDKQDNVAPAFMLYGKYDFTESISARFFDALVYNKSTFNNSGMYFAYHLADALDGRFSFIPLLGVQGLYFKHQNAPKADNNLIYPQGFEMVFRHAFNIENYVVVYGMFFSTNTAEDYTNTWVRWGKNYFWELNYINWGKGDYKTEMFGLSIGFLLGQWF
jgi:hypothetical protein